jgi:H+/gluconate symporter-like permease
MKDTYDALHRMEKLIFVMSAIVVILFLIIKFDENVPLWVMITAVIVALMDGFFVIGYSSKKDEVQKQLKERRDKNE